MSKEKRGACVDPTDPDYIAKMKVVRKLRGRIEVLLDDTFVALCTRAAHNATPNIKQYAEKRQQMLRLGMSEEDIGYYDSRFKGMPWEIAGLETPKIDEY